MIVLPFRKEEDTIEHTNAKGHVFTIMVNWLTIVYNRHWPYYIVGAYLCLVSRGYIVG